MSLEILKYSRSYIWAYLKPVITIYLTVAGRELLQVSYDLVKQAEADMADVEARRRWVVDQVKQHNINTKDSHIGLAVELAVQRLKTEK